MAAWRIDTLDARGGLAFVTPEGGADSESSLFFIGAPDFLPQPIVNRSIAHAAARGIFQNGLFTKDSKEILFPKLSDVAEFVRRTYTRSGGGDGSDGGGENLPPVPDIPRLREGLGPLQPDHEEEDRGGEKNGISLRTGISYALESFVSQSQSLSEDHGVEGTEKCSWPKVAVQGSQQQVFKDGSDMLTAGALRLLGELIIRMPPLSNAREFSQWSRSARPLGAYISRLGLWPLFLPYHRTLNKFYKILDNANVPEYFHFPSHIRSKEWALDILSILINGNNDWHRGGVSIPSDPVSALRLIPVPTDIAKSCGLDNRQGSSLFHLLSAVIGSPSTTINHSDDVFDLLLFASACIVNVGGVQSSLQLVVNDAWAWLHEHLPKVVYSEQLEEIISKAAELRYPMENHENNYK